MAAGSDDIFSPAVSMWVPAAAACHLTYDLEHGLPVADAPAAVSAAVSPLSVDKGEEEEFLLHTTLDRSRFTGHDIFPTEKRTGHFFVEIKRKNVIGTRCSCWSTIPRQNDSLIPTVALSRHARHSVHFVHFKEKENEMDRPSLRQPIDRSTVDLTLVKRLLTNNGRVEIPGADKANNKWRAISTHTLQHVEQAGEYTDATDDLWTPEEAANNTMKRCACTLALYLCPAQYNRTAKWTTHTCGQNARFATRLLMVAPFIFVGEITGPSSGCAH